MTINFSSNWNNKLDCQAFTSIRLHDARKYAVGFQYQILLKDKHHCHAKCMELKTFKLSALTNFMAYIDTGYNKFAAQKIFKNFYPDINIYESLFDFMLFKKVEVKEEVIQASFLEVSAFSGTLRVCPHV